MRVSSAENVSRDDEQILSNGLLNELRGRFARRFGIKIKRATGLRKLIDPPERIGQEISLPAIVGDDGGDVKIQCRHTRVLNDTWCTNERELLQFRHRF